MRERASRFQPWGGFEAFSVSCRVSAASSSGEIPFRRSCSVSPFTRSSTYWKPLQEFLGRKKLRDFLGWPPRSRSSTVMLLSISAMVRRVISSSVSGMGILSSR